MLLYVSYKKKHLLKPAEFFIINLAISDLGMTLSLYPLAVTSSFAHRYHKEGKTKIVVTLFNRILDLSPSNLDTCISTASHLSHDCCCLSKTKKYVIWQRIFTWVCIWTAIKY